jgi:hypothetical protein
MGLFGDVFGGFQFQGYNGSYFTSCANIQAFIDGTVSSTATPGRITFNTSPSGSVSPTERIRIDSAGNVGIGTAGGAATSALLELKSTTGALLIPRMTTTQKNALTAVNGMIVYDSTLNKFQGYENSAWTSFI